MRKPFGVIATAVYAGFGGVIMFPLGLLLLVAGQVSGADGVLFTSVGILFCILGVALLAVTYGLWSLQELGRKVMFWLSGAFIPLGVVSIFPVWPGQEITMGNTVLQVVGIGVSGLIMFYVSRSRIKTLFESTGV
jgi:hypothetical protein